MNRERNSRRVRRLAPIGRADLPESVAGAFEFPE